MSLSRFTRALALAAAALSATTVSALYLRPDLEKVPVERLAKNLQEAIDKNPKDANAVLNLARLHGMAYALRSDTVEVKKDMPGVAWFDFEPPNVPFNRVEKVEDRERLKAAKEHLDNAIKLYEQALKLAPDNLTAQLGHAWLLTQTDKKAEAAAALRKIVEKGWDQEKNLMFLKLGQHPVTAEAADYLVPLLDKDKDKDEIATLKERSDKLKKLPRPVTPIAVPLRAGLTAADIEDRNAAVAFDADGSGLRKKWSWVTREAAWLVHDPKRSGKVTSALQLFGNVTFWLFWDTGYEALAALDDDRDGRLTGKELDGLALWHDANGNGVSEPGEVKPLSEFGIVALSCKSERDPNHPDRIAFSKTGVTFRDGTTRPTFDLVLHPAE